MTFYEAALRVLESEGRPLHFLEITEKSIAQNLLSHVGKTPEITMLSRLAAMARRTRDRKVVVTAKDTFALVDWSLPEDPEALAQTGVPEPNPEEELPPLRPVERHPEARMDNVRVAGRGSERKRRRDEEEGERGRKRRFPPLPEVVFEILSESAGPLRTEDLIESAKGKELAPDDVTVEAVLTALLEDNQRRIDAGRRPQFSFNKESGEVALERAGAPSEAPPLELQAAFAQALGIPLEGGRPVLGRPAAAAGAEALLDPALLLSARTAVKEARRAVARGLRKRLGELDVGTFEKSVVKTMHGLGFRELKVAKRGKEGPLLTARRREGSVELRFAVRLLKGTPAIDRKMVQELRRDLGHYAAQVGLLVSAGDVRGDARSEAQASGALVMLWCGDALGEKFLEAKAGVSVTQVEMFDIDDRFFEVAKLEAEEAQRRREERQREKREGGEGEESEGGQPSEAPAESPRRKDRDARREEREARRAARREEREARARAEGAEARPAEAAPEAEQAAAPGAPEAEARPAAPPPSEAVSALDEEQGEEGDEEGEDDDLDAATAFVNGARPEGGAPGAEGAPGERKRRRRRRRGRRGRGKGGTEAGAASPGTAPAEGGAPSTEGGAPSAEATPAGGEAPAVAAAETRAEPAAEPVAPAAPVAEPPAPPPPPSGSGSPEGGEA
ncbi:HTH domain-containing protein [Myxococcaceae bacterium GXIMD 01537]